MRSAHAPGGLALRRAACWTTAVLLSAVPVAACGTVEQARPIVVIASATRNEPAPQLGNAEIALLRTAAGTGDAKVTLVTPAGTTTLPLTPHRQNGEVEHGPRREDLLDDNIEAIKKALGVLAATGAFDLLDKLDTAARVSSSPGVLLVVSSGVSTAGGFDMRRVLWGADPRVVARQLKDRDLLPPLPGWTVVFVGLGDTLPPQPRLPEHARRTLIAYWKAICHETGAAVCTVDDAPRPTTPSLSSVPVPPVPVPTVTSVEGPDRTVHTFPADLFFDFDSAVLDSSARRILAPLARTIREQRLTVTVTGFASPDGGTAAYNRTLSKRRARAVWAALIALGVPPTAFPPHAVTGVGVDDYPPSAGRTHGRLDPLKCAQLRRVVVTTHPSHSSSTP